MKSVLRLLYVILLLPVIAISFIANALWSAVVVGWRLANDASQWLFVDAA